MKIIKIGAPQKIMRNNHSKHNYFAWPTAARLQNGKIAVVASGYRLSHVCPFGKTVISFSEDEGESYTIPAPVIDTVLDDRDGGILAFGKGGVMVTSFNNATAFQESVIIKDMEARQGKKGIWDDYKLAYLRTVSPQEEAEALGSHIRISKDFGTTFGELIKSPVTSPHGPCELSDGTILWVGSKFGKVNENENRIKSYKVNPDGSFEHLGEIENIPGLYSAEPYAIELPGGKIICCIRAENENTFTTYQSESYDKGRTWTKPRRILNDKDGAPTHILRLSSGVLIATYGYRVSPFGIMAMFSTDEGETWDTNHEIYNNNGVSADIGYPSTVELMDGSLLTVFYCHPRSEMPAVIMQQKWKLKV
ncbi:MAG: sialidase family protein [Acutalibacteraceae bacterium]|jgi:sialidase-1